MCFLLFSFSFITLIPWLWSSAQTLIHILNLTPFPQLLNIHLQVTNVSHYHSYQQLSVHFCMLIAIIM